MTQESITTPDKKELFLRRLAGVFERVGARFEDVAPGIKNRLWLLAETTKTVEDELRAVELAWKLFEWYEKRKPQEVFSELEKRIIVIGTLFTDIGKTGPAQATEAQQQLIAEMYAVESVIDARTTSIEQFFERFFEADSEARIRAFHEMELDSKMTMREFYNLHAQWSLDITRGDGVPEEAEAAVATHHLIEGINPESLVDKKGRFTKYFGENPKFDRQEKVVIIFDHYDAERKRSKLSHEEALEAIIKRAGSNPRFANDREFFTLLENFDAMMREWQEAGSGPY